MAMELLERMAGITRSDPPVYYDVVAPKDRSGGRSGGRSGRPWLAPVHGGAHTGSCYLTTADGRPGWAHVFADRGFPVAVPDWPGSGRSAPVPLDALDGETVCRRLAGLLETLAGPVVLMTHSMSGAFGWRLLETHGDKIAALVAAAPAPPGNIQAVAEIIERGADFVEVKALELTWRMRLDQYWWADERVIEQKIVGPSTRFTRQMLETYTAMLQPVAPRLIYQRQNVEGSQIKVSDTSGFRGKPVLIVTGEHDIDHSREVDGAVAEWLAEAGADIEFHYLADHGIGGNGHIMMVEDNSDEIANLIADWLDRTLGVSR